MAPTSNDEAPCPLFSDINLDRDVNISEVIPGVRNNLPTKTLYINGSGSGRPVTFQLCGTEPGMLPHVTFDVEPQMDDNGCAKSRIPITLSVPKDYKELHDFWKRMDDKVIEHVISRKQDYFKKSPSDDDIRGMLQPTIRNDPDGQYLPTFKARFDCTPGCRNQCTVFELNSDTNELTEISASCIGKKDQVIPIISLGMIYNMNGRIGYCKDICSMVVIKAARSTSMNFNFGGKVLKHKNLQEDFVEAKQEDFEANGGASVVLDPITLAPVVNSSGAGDEQDSDDKKRKAAGKDEKASVKRRK